MNLIELVKKYREILAERLLPQPVVFHHVPKCGGTSLGRALRKRYFLSQSGMNHPAVLEMILAKYPDISHEARWANVHRFKEETLLYLLQTGTRCVVAHVSFSPLAYKLFSPQYHFITLLRDPVERFISNYYYSYHGRLDMSLDAFLQTDAATHMGARYLHYFYGGNDWSEMFTAAAVERAKSNLNCFSVVGFLDDLPSFYRQMSDTLGTRLKMGHENKGRTEAARGEFSAPQMARVRELCEPDIQIYRYAQERYGSAMRQDSA